MDQTPPFQPAFNMEFFSSLHLPHGMGLGDSLDHPKAKGSFADLQSPLVNFKTNMHADHHHDSSFLDHNNFFLQQREDDMFHEPYAAFKVDSHLKNWQPPQNHGFLDVNLDPWFNKDKDFGLDPFQIRSRGGSFNFGRLRKDSEDFFHMNSDFFRQIRNITESKGPFENNFMKKPFQMQDAFEMPITDDAHAISTQIPQSIPTNYAGIPSHLQGTGMVVSAQNTDTTVDTAAEGSDGAKKKGRKKRILNDKTELVDEDSNSKPASKAGRPKKVKEGNDEEPKPQKAKKQSKAAKMGNFDMDGETCVKQEKDDKSTEISSSSASKIEDSPHGIKPNTDIMSEIMKIKAPENLKEILGGMNVPNEVKEFFQKTTNWMGQGANAETRKIGTLTLAERRAKIEKYLQKRKKRTWSRKINYDCRKRVADSRLRIKGRFVTRDQAFTLLEEANIPFNPETITNAEIKTLLTDKFGGSVLKKKSSEKQDTTICLKRPNEKELEEYELEDNDDFGSATSE